MPNKLTDPGYFALTSQAPLKSSLNGVPPQSTGTNDRGAVRAVHNQKGELESPIKVT